MTPQLRSYCFDYLQLICSKEKGITTSFEELKNLHGSTKPYHKDEILEVLQRNGYINLYSRMVSATNEGIAFSKKASLK
ncbi:MAG: hypothetical protein ABI415_00520 [Flavitalea sp.]